MKKTFTFLTLLAALPQLFTLLAPLHWFMELFSHYLLYYAVLDLLLLIPTLLFQKWPSTIFLTTFLSLNLAGVHPYLTVSAPKIEREATLRILAQNFYYTNTHFEEIEALLTAEAPDLFIIHEAGPQWEEGQKLFQESYPNLALTEETGVHGILMGSRIPGDFQEIPLGSKFGLEFIPESGAYRVLAVHPAAPITATWAEERNAQFADIELYVKESPLPTLVVGDFNCTPWSPFFTQLLENADLKDARVGFGLVPTWHANNWFFSLPVDHVLTTSEWTIHDFSSTKKTSADHLGITAELSF